ncbi:MAG TPA: O-antigen ligase family protein [Nitrospiraceae bacterium]|nr:O-antigen ligase family protein [Nitrospiraceae bacterium]
MAQQLQAAHGSVVTLRFYEGFWKVQGIGLIVMAGSSFFPPLYHWQEYGFFTLLTLAVGVVIGMRSSPWVRTPVDLPLGCFLGWVLCTVPFSTDVGYSLAEWRKFVAHAVVFYWALLVFREQGGERLARRVLAAVAVGSAVLSLYALADFFGRGGNWRDRFVRAVALRSDYNWLSTYMVLSIPVLVGLLVTERQWIARLGTGAALVGSVLAQIASYGRAGWLGHAAQGLAMAFLAERRRHILLVVGLIAALTASLFLLSRVGFQTDTVDRWTFMSRISVWKLGLQDIKEHPIVGIGYGNNTFIKRHPEYAADVQNRYPERERVPPSMHNAFLMVTLGSGIPALVGFCWLFIRLIRLLSSRLHDLATAPSTVLALSIAMAVVGFGVRNLFDYMFMGSLSHLFWILVATGTVLRHPSLLAEGGAKGDADGVPDHQEVRL